jgi:lipopolysaccharide export system permease protein
VQLLRQSALKEAQFGQLDAGRFRSFSGGDAVFYAERVDRGRHPAQRLRAARVRGRIEVALAESATYSKGPPTARTWSRCSTGAATRASPGRADFRVIEFREHGIPIVTPTGRCRAPRIRTPSRRVELLGSLAPSDIAQLQIRGSAPIMAAAADADRRALEPAAAAPGPLRALGLRHRHLLFVFEPAVGGQGVAGEGRSCRPSIGVWWVHLIALALGLYLLGADREGWRRAAATP